MTARGGTTFEPDSRVGHAVWAIAGLLLATILVAIYVYLSPLSCLMTCEADALAASQAIFFIALPVPTIIAVVGTVILRHRGWLVLTAPLLGGVALALLSIATAAGIHAALNP